MIKHLFIGVRASISPSLVAEFLVKRRKRREKHNHKIILRYYLYDSESKYAQLCYKRSHKWKLTTASKLQHDYRKIKSTQNLCLQEREAFDSDKDLKNDKEIDHQLTSKLVYITNFFPIHAQNSCNGRTGFE